MRQLVVTLCLVSTLVLASRSAHARPYQDRQATSPVRDGFTMGASIGRGSIDVRCETCVDAKLSEALSVSGHLGYMVTPQLAIVGEHWTVRFEDRGSALFDDSNIHTVTQHMSALAAQLFVTERLWIKGGFGFGWHVSDGDYGDMPTEDRMALHNGMAKESEGRVLGTTRFVAVGVEIAHNQFFAADLQLRAGSTSRPDDRYKVYNTGLNVGFNWY